MHLNVRIDHLVVGVRELAFDGLARALQPGAQSRAHVSWQIEVHQAVGSANLNFGVAVASRFDQRIETPLRADFHDRFHRLNADVEFRILQQRLELGKGVRAALSQFADIFRTRDLGGKQRSKQYKQKGVLEGHVFKLQ